MARATLAAVMIVRDEEANLRELAARYWHAFDEVVVVDGGSSDRSTDIARSSKVRLFERPFDNFAAQRNFALAQVQSDWCLSLDADERPTPAMLRETRQVLAEQRASAFRVPIRSTIFGRRFRYSGTQNDLPIRLFRRDAAIWQGDVHEVLRVSGRVGRLRAGLEHDTLPDLPSFLAKMNRYTALEAAARVEHARRPRRHELYSAPLVELFRRLVWKHGWLDGPEGWAFCALSGLSAYVLAARHRRLWHLSPCATPPPDAASSATVRVDKTATPSALLSARA
ncbi:MAG: glycosyltransferase family 2 protein [Pirellulales bacterium]|nr:glycosyltransferase family 2 protein [Pirellulales bacterium]